MPKLFYASCPNSGTEVMIKSEYLDIYFVTEAGSLESANIYLRCTAEDIFAEWAKFNNIPDVSLIECNLDSDAEIIIKGDPNDPDTPIEHHGGDTCTLVLTVSSEFSNYANMGNGEILIDSLKQTFFSYSEFDEFKLIIQK